jgi:hypothetical protein
VPHTGAFLLHEVGDSNAAVTELDGMEGDDEPREQGCAERARAPDCEGTCE